MFIFMFLVSYALEHFLFNPLVPEFSAHCTVQKTRIEMAYSLLFMLLPNDCSGHSAFSALHCTMSIFVLQHQRDKECQFVMSVDLVHETVCSLFTRVCSVIHCWMMVIFGWFGIQ
jgi:hypothetical protein